MRNNRMMVMVASLERHLESERKIIYEAIVGQRAIPVGLSFPPMAANYLLKLNHQCLADADYLFLLIGKEYGPVSEKGTSHLHQIYATAQVLRKPIVSFVYIGDSALKTDPFDQKRREGFVSTLSNGTVFYWSTSDELRDCVERGIELVQEKQPSTGWVKADFVSTGGESKEADGAQVNKLKAEIESLKKLHDSNAEKSSYLKEAFKLDSEPWPVKYTCHAFREGRLKQFSGERYLDIKQTFDWLSAALLSPITEARIQAIIAKNIQGFALMDAKQQWLGCHAVSDIKIVSSSLDLLKKRLRFIGVISFDEQGRWRLTADAERNLLSNQNDASFE